jgi:methyl-accepting chemotaxis protein
MTLPFDGGLEMSVLWLSSIQSHSAKVLISAQSLSGESNRLRLEVGRFLDTVRAA